MCNFHCHFHNSFDSIVNMDSKKNIFKNLHQVNILNHIFDSQDLKIRVRVQEEVLGQGYGIHWYKFFLFFFNSFLFILIAINQTTLHVFSLKSKNTLKKKSNKSRAYDVDVSMKYVLSVQNSQE